MKQGNTKSIDTDRLRRLSDQLSELVEELDDIKEDLNEMLEGIGNHYDLADYANRYKDICDTVNGAYQELNKALDEMEELL